MDDHKIVTLYWQRDESAIAETQRKYGRFCYAIAYNLLQNHEDAEECENDTYLDAWNTMPPQKPAILSSFLGMITRRRALDRYRIKRAQKRGGDAVHLSFEELEECIATPKSLDDEITAEELASALNRFLLSLPARECDVFLRRYWFFDAVRDICEMYGYGESKVKMMLKRTRDKLAAYLEKEGFLR
ncbi:MAG: sigma-70 family RNA polymerase sigma factor [Clostridia bacterium]|nr:sigma-70 family RNA polymerase sigma factor [Clostridia bacterium]